MDYSNFYRHPLPVGIVILHYGSLHDTLACMESVRSADPGPRKILVVNNSCDAQTKQELTDLFKNYPKATFLNPLRNLGYTGGMNAGIRTLLADDTLKVILLLNNDTVVKPDFLGPLFFSLRDGSGFHLATPRILFEDAVRIWSTGERVCYPFLFARRSIGKPDGPDCPVGKTINAISGCAMAIRCEVFDRIGLFDENYFAYVEDVDFCLRAHSDGFRFAYCPQSIVFHKASKSLGEFSPAKVYLNVRNKAYFIKKNIPSVLWPISWLWYLSTISFWVVRALAEGKMDVVRSVILGGRDFLKHRMGPPPWQS